MSGGIGPFRWKMLNKTHKRNSRYLDQDITAYYNRQSVLNLINNMRNSLKKSVRWHIDAGDDDGLSEGDALVHVAMRKKEIRRNSVLQMETYMNYWRAALISCVTNIVSVAFLFTHATCTNASPSLKPSSSPASICQRTDSSDCPAYYLSGSTRFGVIVCRYILVGDTGSFLL